MRNIKKYVHVLHCMKGHYIEYHTSNRSALQGATNIIKENDGTNVTMHDNKNVLVIEYEAKDSFGSYKPLVIIVTKKELLTI